MTTAVALLASLFVTVLVAGLFLVLWGLFGPWQPRASKPSNEGSGLEALQKSSSSGADFVKRFALAIGTAAAAFWLTGWPVAAIFAFVAGYAQLSIRRESQEKARQLRQLSALATWTEALKDTMAASAGINEALTISAKVAPQEIKPDVVRLVQRMQTQSTTVALARFAQEVANPAADMIVASFTLAITKQAGSLNDILLATSRNIRDMAALSQQVEAGRTEVRTQSKLAIGIIGSVMLGMIVLRRDALEPFDTFFGQMFLALILSLFALSGFLFYRLGRSAPPRRVFIQLSAGDLEQGRSS